MKLLTTWIVVFGLKSGRLSSYCFQTEHGARELYDRLIDDMPKFLTEVRESSGQCAQNSGIKMSESESE